MKSYNDSEREVILRLALEHDADDGSLDPACELIENAIAAADPVRLMCALDTPFVGADA